MPEDATTLIGLGVAAALLLWLVFSVMRKLFGFLLLGAILFGAYMLWTNPELLQGATETIMGAG